MSLDLDVLRHGDTGAAGFRGRLDDALTETGWRQMREAVADAGPWDLILSSPLQRCAAFARELAAARKLPCRIEARLAELDFGAWEGKTHEELLLSEPDALRAFWSDPWAHGPRGGETLGEFARRVFAAFDELAAHLPHGRVLAVTHGGVIRLSLARARGLPSARLAQFEVAHGSLHRLALPWTTPGPMAAG